MTAERIEGVLEHITYTKGVVGVVVCTAEGEPIRDSFQNIDRSLAQSYALMAADLARQASLLFAPAKSRTLGTSDDASEMSSKLSSAKKSPAGSPLQPIYESPLELIRVRTLLHEIIIRCSEEFLIAIVQEPVD